VSRVDGGFLALDEVVVEGVFEVAFGVGLVEVMAGVGFVFAEENGGVLVAVEMEVAEGGVAGSDEAGVFSLDEGADGIVFPGPGVAKPELGKDMDGSCVGAAIVDGD
jgi:hypothetical protein